MQQHRKVPGPALPGEIAQGRPDLPLVAITFDLNQSSGEVGGLPRVLDVLRERGVRSTFFVTGLWMQPNRDWVRRVSEAGHEIGNQGWDHEDMTEMTAEQVAAQLEDTDALVRETIGRTTKPYFRAPLGLRDERLLETVDHLGYTSVFLNLESGDVRATATPESTRQRVLARTQNGQIILFHPHTPVCHQVIDDVIVGLRERGFQLVTISQLAAGGTTE